MVDRPGAPGGTAADPVVGRWPEEADAAAPRRDWRDTLRNASDLALVGILAAIGSLGVVTAGGAVATASAAVHDWIETDSWPGLRPTLHRFARALLPGAVATLALLAVTALLGVNLLALHRGVVPGGAPLVVLTVVLAVAGAGLAGLTLVEVGRRGGRDWLAATRAAALTAGAHPGLLLATAGVAALVAVLGVMILPAVIPILGGYALLALHAVVRRTERRHPAKAG
ncbi:hypothetical protein [Polymorphospora lycopeni]|uniref:DUF624 domain-containing protein n=1 Tax=Polymorphospora lycopeni TaxID=3140240 RepID=A0ABV5CTF9_9ACTN